MKNLTKPILISYGALAVPLAALGLPLTVYLPPFYEGPIGLSVGTVGIIFMIARFWDIFTDPLMGALVDRYPSKWGRRKHWIVIGIPILMLASWYVFIPSEGEKTPIYLAFWLFILYLAYTFVGLTQQAWGVDLTSKYNERSQVYGWREIGSIFGMMSVLAFPAILEIFGYDFRTMIAGMGYFLLVAFPLTALISLIIMKVISYNINGIRAAIKKGLIQWIKKINADVICFQEIKANLDQFDEKKFISLGYNCYWNSAHKKGYSGVAILCKKKPNKVIYGMNDGQID